MATQTKYRKPLLVSPPPELRVTSILDARVPQPHVWHLLPADVRQRVDLLTVLRVIVPDESVPALDQELLGLLCPYQPSDPRQYQWCVMWTYRLGVGACVHSRHQSQESADDEAARCNDLCDPSRSLYRVERCSHVAPHACPPANVDLLSGAGYRLERNGHGWTAVRED
jgi:hypothetical protein